MEFGSNRESFCEEEHQSSTTGKPKLHFSYNSSSSSPSSSSSQYKTTQQLGPSLSNNNRQQMGCWLGSKYDPADEEASTNKLDLMEEDVRSASTISNIEKEHMFDKVVTPSDVGKLNRLVIPKQHAEKFFPLDSSANEKGLLLNFEDRNGKPWRFRYSYWNSSQSYVMTKGWSRFVKDKKLGAGDIVSFQHGVGDLARDRLYIDWRRRPDAPEPSSFPLQHHLSFHRSIPWSPMLMRPPPAPVMTRDHLHMSQMNHFLNRNGYYDGGGGGGDGGYGYGYGSGSNNVMNPCHMGSVFYLRSQPLQSQPLQEQMGMSMGEWQSRHHQYQHQQQQDNTMVFDSVPVVQGKAAAKRLRLFGVNMDCPISETSTTDDDECDIVLSSTTLQHAPIMPTIQHHNHHHQLSSSSSSHSQAAAPLQLRLYNGTPMPPPMDFLNKGKASMS